MPRKFVIAVLVTVLAAAVLPDRALADGQHTLAVTAVVLPKVVCHEAKGQGALAYAGAMLTAPGQVTARLSTTRVCDNSMAITRTGRQGDRAPERRDGPAAPFRVRAITRQPDGSVVIDVEP